MYPHVRQFETVRLLLDRELSLDNRENQRASRFARWLFHAPVAAGPSLAAATERRQEADARHAAA
jgi:hypothetical protein